LSYVRPASRVPVVGVLGRGRLRGLGFQTSMLPGGESRSFGPIFARPGNPGNVPPPMSITPQPYAAPVTATLPSSGSTAAQVSGTPVPVGYNRNSVFINSDGSQWEYSTSQGVWVNVGSPYNLAAPSAPTPGTTSSTASSGAQIAGTPVPVGYPTTSPYFDIYGNTWNFNAATGTWVETAQAAAATNILASGAGTVPVGTPDNAPYTDANGNTWTYNSATGQWQETALATASDSYSSILSWLTQSSLLSPVPNWALVAGLGFIALKMMHPSAPTKGGR
jgi:hypothetical protein